MLGYIFGDFFTNSSGHPDCEQRITSVEAANYFQIIEEKATITYDKFFQVCFLVFLFLKSLFLVPMKSRFSHFSKSLFFGAQQFCGRC
jgi:hypothetical protein